tara:strand:- start:1509 stop:2498 length:990 start_codon:yes stop_codon:yes gene_type:complete
MEFASPYYLLLLILLPLFCFWYFYWGKENEGTIKYSNTELVPDISKKIGIWKNIVLVITKLIIMFLIIIALARPRIINIINETKTEIIDILLVIDQSSSMLAQDFKPNRLEAAKEVAKQFIKNREGDRLGIIVFAGESYIQCPITRDINVLIDFTNQIEIIDREFDGTAIGMALANSINRLRSSDSESKIIILLSDGSNNSGELDPITAADLAKKFDIKIYTVAAGKKGMAPYPVADAWGRKIIKNVQVDVDEETLKQIAKITDGKFFRATDNESLKKVYNEINSLEKTVVEIKEYQNYKEMYSWFTIPAAIISVLLVFITNIGFYKIF